MDVTYHGYTPEELKKVKAIVKQIKSTTRGKELFDSAEKNKKRDIQITKDTKNTPQYEPKTDKIDFDPNFKPTITVAVTPTIPTGSVPASPERVLAHEMGHAVTGTLDDGPGNMNNVNQNENPVAKQLKQPERTTY